MPETARYRIGRIARRILPAAFLFPVVGPAVDSSSGEQAPTRSIPVFKARLIDATTCVAELKQDDPSASAKRVILRDFRGASAEDCAAAAASSDPVLVHQWIAFADASRVLGLIERCVQVDAPCAEMDADDRSRLVQFLARKKVVWFQGSYEFSTPWSLVACGGGRLGSEEGCVGLSFGIDGERIVHFSAGPILE